MNIWRILGDLCLVSSSPIFIYKALNNGPTEISLSTQLLRLLMFITRYLDVFTIFISPYNTLMKCFLILSTLILVLILVVQKFSKRGYGRIGPTTRFAVVITLSTSAYNAFNVNYSSSLEFLRTFSLYLSLGSEIPQLSKLNFMDKWDNLLIAYYIGICGRVAFYMATWAYLYLTEGLIGPISMCCAIIELLVIYAFFARGYFAMRRRAVNKSIVTSVDSESKTFPADENYPPEKLPFIIIEEVA